MKSFEETLVAMPKPEVRELKHQEAFLHAITKIRDWNVVSLWWVLIPLYVLAMLVMHSLYMPISGFRSGLRELTGKGGIVVPVISIGVPALLLVVNALKIRTLYSLCGGRPSRTFVRAMIVPLLVIVLCLLCLIILIT